MNRSSDETSVLWSYSKLRSLFECPPNFWRTYILKKPPPQAVILVVGSSLHFLVKQFFAVHYKSADSFVASWRHFWLGVADGKHGPEGFRGPPVQIAWNSFKAQKFYWLHEGGKVLRGFYERNDKRRGIWVGQMRERMFRTPSWHGFNLNGVIDRIDVVPIRRRGGHCGPLGVRIIDYKMGKTDPDSYQPAIYAIGFNLVLRRKFFGGLPLLSIATENLFTGKRLQLEIRTGRQLERLHADMVEGTAYIRSLKTGQPVADLLQPQIKRLPTDASGRPVLAHIGSTLCKYCPTPGQCRRQIVAETGTRVGRATHASWCDLVDLDRRLTMPDQLDLALE